MQTKRGGFRLRAPSRSTRLGRASQVLARPLLTPALGQSPIALGLKGRDGRPPWWSVRDARWRLIIYVNSPQVELYDHDADPEGVVNLAGGAEGSEARRAEAALREALCTKVPDPDHPLTFGDANPCIGHRMPRSPRLP